MPSIDSRISKDDSTEETSDQPSPPNNVVLSNKIQVELFRQLGKRPTGYKNIEVKTILPSKAFRVNLVCRKNEGILETVHRPYSYYVTCVADGIIFEPPVIPID